MDYSAFLTIIIVFGGKKLILYKLIVIYEGLTLLIAEQFGQQSKILVVDDNLQNVLVLEAILKDCGEVHFSESAKNAFALIPSLSPDIILLDIKMPEMNGWEMFRALKEDPAFSRIPVVFITAYDEPHIETLSLELGGVDFITKPFNADVCRLRVGNLLQMQKQNRLILKAQEQVQQLVEQVPILISYWDNNWQLIFSNENKTNWFKKEHLEESDRSLDLLFPSELASTIKTKALIGDAVNYSEKVSDEDKTYYYQVYQSHFTTSDDLEGHLVTLVDMTETQQAKRALQSEKELLRVTLNSIGDSVIATDSNGLVTFMNPIAERMTGWRYSRANGQNISLIMKLRDIDTKETVQNPIFLAINEKRRVAMAMNCELVSDDGYVYAIEDSAAPIKDSSGEVIGAIIVCHNVSDVMAMALKMSYLANYDQLTNLPNRMLLQDRLSVACRKANSKNNKVSLILLDIDNFKYINDSFGHQKGDDLICQLAQRLKANIPKSATLARLSGDEFVILASDISLAVSPSTLANNILTAMAEPFLLDSARHEITVSMGISVYPTDAKDAQQLMHHADVAMYRAKQEGRNRYRHYSSHLEESVKKRYKLEMELKTAIADNRILVYFQPKFELHSKRIVGAEALVRLKTVSGEVLYPNSFIALAEETGLIVELGRQVLDKACEYTRSLLDLGVEIPVSVNVAAAQFDSPDLESHIVRALKTNDVPANMLELEITETAIMMDAVRTKLKLEKLKSLGIKISIDDFGTGYSSLSYLKKFNVDVLKIDMSFVREMLVDKQDYEIVKTIVLLGRSLNLNIVAEGVETQDQCEALINIGCEIGQGYLYSKPLPFDGFLELIQA